jgi:hypothetical protein
VEPVVAAPPRSEVRAASAPARRDVAVRDGVAGFVAGVVALAVVLVAAASFAATQA